MESNAGPRRACEGCGATDRDVVRSDELDVTLCADCFARCADGVETAALVTQVERYAGRYLVLPGEAEATALALWTLHTHALDGAHATPYLLILSPEKRSGKTRVQEVLELLAARPWRVTGASEAAIFRKIALQRPTLLLDEIDAIFAGFSERTEPLRAILNAGNRPGASVARCVGDKGDQVRDFPIFCPKALAGIDKGDRIPDTIRDRAISIAMRRKTGAEPVERFRFREAEAAAGPLRDRLCAWGQVVAERLLEAEPAQPPQLDDRAAEAWEPLLAIADMAGGVWPARAREAAITLSAPDKREEQSLGTTLLVAIRAAFGDEDRVTTADLLARVNADDELPFGGWRDGKGLDGRILAKLLRPYWVRPVAPGGPGERLGPRTIKLRDGSTAKGYLREWFVDAWERWTPSRSTDALPASPASPVTGRLTGAPHDKPKLRGLRK
jgi:hypothetical protein